MPIGKNALKRVSNNGYSNVKTSAPDMENSEVQESKKEAAKKPTEKKAVPKPAAAEKKSTEKKEASGVKKEEKEAKKPLAKKPAQKKTKSEIAPVAANEETSHPDGFVRIAFGDDMPIHLL